MSGQITVTKSVYFQDGNEFPVDIPYLIFQEDGNVSLNGSDDVGEFEFSGRSDREYLFLTKQYIGQHAVYYVGKLDENRLNLYYAFEQNDDEGKDKVDANEINSLMEFDADQMREFKNNPEGEVWQFFFNSGLKGTFKGKYGYKLRLSRCCYFQDGEEFPVDIKYLYFQQDGNVTLTGSDDVGKFKFTGRAEGEYMFLTKQYIGQHAVYYVGKLEGNLLNLYYAFEQDEDGGKEKVDAGEINSLMEFESEPFNFFRNGSDGESTGFFLNKGEKAGRFKGLGRIKGRTVKISYKDKDENKGKLQMKYNDYEKTYKVDRTFETNDLIVNEDCNNEFALTATQCFYIIEGQEIGFYMPKLTFKDDGSCAAEYIDNNGLYNITGQFEGNYLILKKTYFDVLNVYFVGKFNRNRLELAYGFNEGENDSLKEQLDSGNHNAYIDFNLNHYDFELEGVNCHTFLFEEEPKYKGFSVNANEQKMYMISMKTKEGKKTKLKMKRDKEVRYVKCDVDHEALLINVALPVGMGL